MHVGSGTGKFGESEPRVPRLPARAAALTPRLRLLGGFTCIACRADLGLAAPPATSGLTLGQPPAPSLGFLIGKRWGLRGSCLLASRKAGGPAPSPLKAQGVLEGTV